MTQKLTREEVSAIGSALLQGLNLCERYLNRDLSNWNDGEKAMLRTFLLSFPKSVSLNLWEGLQAQGNGWDVGMSHNFNKTVPFRDDFSGTGEAIRFLESYLENLEHSNNPKTIGIALLKNLKRAAS